MDELRIYRNLGYGICVMGNETSYDTGAITSVLVAAPDNSGGAIDSARKHLV